MFCCFSDFIYESNTHQSVLVGAFIYPTSYMCKNCNWTCGRRRDNLYFLNYIIYYTENEKNFTLNYHNHRLRCVQIRYISHTTEEIHVWCLYSTRPMKWRRFLCNLICGIVFVWVVFFLELHQIISTRTNRLLSVQFWTQRNSRGKYIHLNISLNII